MTTNCVAGDGLLGAAGLPPGPRQSPHLDEVCGQDQLPVWILGSLCLLQGVYLYFKVHSFNFGKHELQIEHTYQLLDGSKYIGKFTLMKFFFVIFLIQETIVEVSSF